MKNKNKGITLIALVITIIVLLILAGVSISTLTGENSIIGQAAKAKFIAEIKDIEEQITMQDIENETETKFGTVKGVLGKESEYNEKLVIENGKLAYAPEKVTKEEKKWLEDIGISPRSNYYLVMMEETKEKYEGQKNIGTIEELRDLVNEGKFDYDTIYLLENITIKEENWTPIGTEGNAFKGNFEGNNKHITNMKGTYDGSNEKSIGFFGVVEKATIKNLAVSGELKASGSITAVGGIIGKTNGNVTIEGLNSDVTITSSNHAGGCIGFIDGNNIIVEINQFTNTGNITATGNGGTGGCVGWIVEKQTRRRNTSFKYSK